MTNAAAPNPHQLKDGLFISLSLTARLLLKFHLAGRVNVSVREMGSTALERTSPHKDSPHFHIFAHFILVAEDLQPRVNNLPVSKDEMFKSASGKKITLTECKCPLTIVYGGLFLPSQVVPSGGYELP